MPTNQTVSATLAEKSVPAVSASKTATNWSVFEKAHLTPVTIKCDAYSIPGENFSDFSCHTALQFKTDSFKEHIKHEHGNRFRFILRLNDGKASPLWKDLEASGLEAADFRCEVCNEKLRFHPASLQRHLKPHQGKIRQAYAELARNNPKAVGFFCFTLGSQPAEEQLEDLDEYNN